MLNEFKMYAVIGEKGYYSFRYDDWISWLDNHCMTSSREAAEKQAKILSCKVMILLVKEISITTS